MRCYVLLVLQNKMDAEEIEGIQDINVTNVELIKNTRKKN